jgi:hypothetical protein
MKEPRTPSQLWVDYRKSTYGPLTLLPKDLEREIRLGFHGGIEASFRVILEAAHEEPLPTKEVFVEMLMNFRRHNKATALNL